MNLLKETLEILNNNNLNEADVLWCGSVEFGYFTWQDFKDIADVEYDNGYGAPKVATDLVIVTTKGYLERHEYDGSEWWDYKKPLERPETYKKPTALTIEQAESNGVGWKTLPVLNT